VNQSTSEHRVGAVLNLQ